MPKGLEIPVLEAPRAESKARIPALRFGMPQSEAPIPAFRFGTPQSEAPIPLPEAPAPDPTPLKGSPSPSLLFSLSPHRQVWQKLLPRGDRTAASCSGRRKWRKRLHGERAVVEGPTQELDLKYQTGRFWGRGIFRPSVPAQGEALAKGLKPGLGKSRSQHHQPPRRAFHQGA